MKLESGKYYKRRDERIVGPLIDTNDGSSYPFETKEGCSWTPEGRSYLRKESMNDLIAEVASPGGSPTYPNETPSPQTACPYAIIRVLEQELKLSQMDRDDVVDALAQRETEVERLKGQLETDLRFAKGIMNQRDTLRARVEELETYCQRRLHLAMASYKERDDLRTQLTATVKELDTERKSHRETEEQLEGESAALKATQALLREANAKLAELQPKAPTVVKQTWANLYEDSEGDVVDSRAECRARLNNWDYGPVLGMLRRDHYSDGSVKAVLEAIEGGE